MSNLAPRPVPPPAPRRAQDHSRPARSPRNHPSHIISAGERTTSGSARGGAFSRTTLPNEFLLHSEQCRREHSDQPDGAFPAGRRIRPANHIPETGKRDSTCHSIAAATTPGQDFSDAIIPASPGRLDRSATDLASTAITACKAEKGAGLPPRPRQTGPDRRFRPQRPPRPGATGCAWLTCSGMPCMHVVSAPGSGRPRTTTSAPGRTTAGSPPSSRYGERPGTASRAQRASTPAWTRPVAVISCTSAAAPAVLSTPVADTASAPATTHRDVLMQVIAPAAGRERHSKPRCRRDAPTVE